MARSRIEINAELEQLQSRIKYVLKELNDHIDEATEEAYNDGVDEGRDDADYHSAMSSSGAYGDPQ